jgi:hypothetical protein
MIENNCFWSIVTGLTDVVFQMVCSFYLSRDMMWLSCHVDTPFTRAAWRKWGIIISEFPSSSLFQWYLLCFFNRLEIHTIFLLVTVTDMLALFARSQFVICLRYGRNLTWKLQPHQCQNLTWIKWLVEPIKIMCWDLRLWLSDFPKVTPRLTVCWWCYCSAGLDPLQWLWKVLRSAIPCSSSEMHELQVL